MSKALGVLLVCAVGACASAPSTDTASAMTFEDLGCIDELPSDQQQGTTIVRADAPGETTFDVIHPATCGLSARKPGFSINGAALAMRYELYSPNGAVVMCDCAYRSKFKFAKLPSTVKSATFSWSEHER